MEKDRIDLFYNWLLTTYAMTHDVETREDIPLSVHFEALGQAVDKFVDVGDKQKLMDRILELCLN